jgi:hypothetical protein
MRKSFQRPFAKRPILALEGIISQATFHNKCFNLAWILRPQRENQASGEKRDGLPPKERASSWVDFTKKEPQGRKNPKPFIKRGAMGQADAKNVLNSRGIKWILQQMNIPNLLTRKHELSPQKNWKVHQIDIGNRPKIMHQRDPRGVPNIHSQTTW